MSSGTTTNASAIPYRRRVSFSSEASRDAVQILCLAWLFLVGCVCRGQDAAADAAGSGAIPAKSWVVFASPGCEECHWLEQEFFPDLRASTGVSLPPVYSVDIDAEGGYELLMGVERELGVSGEAFPALVVGRKIYYGQAGIPALAGDLSGAVPEPVLPDSVRVLLQGSELVIPFLGAPESAPAEPVEPQSLHVSPPSQDASALRAQGTYSDAQILYFRTTGCKACSRAEKQLAHFSREFPGCTVHIVDAMLPEGRVLQMAVATRLELSKHRRLTTPMFVSGAEAVVKGEITDDRLRTLFETAPPAPFWGHWNADVEFAAARAEMETMLGAFTISTVLLAGLADGVNPCAFAVILFLVSYLTLAGKLGRRYALIYGLAFCAGVFACYLLIGLGFVRLLDVLQRWQGAFRILLVVTGGGCLLFAVAAAVDVVRARRYGPERMVFGMPKPLKALAHKLIRQNVGHGVMGVGAFVLGVAVSGLELVCTGQIYLPVIMYINSTAPGGRSIVLLVFYNLVFVLPLLAVLFIGVYGGGSKRLNAWGRKHAVLTRAAAGLVVLVLGILLLVTALR